MRSIAQCLPLAVLATLVNACERPTAPTSRPASVLVERSPNASISDAVNGGRLGFYFLPSLVANPGPLTRHSMRRSPLMRRSVRWSTRSSVVATGITS